jgi:replication factor C subunit 3/5
MSSAKSLPHLLVYGPSGAGKKTRIHALLRGLYGNTVDKLRLESKTFTTPTNRKVEVRMGEGGEIGRGGGRATDRT